MHKRRHPVPCWSYPETTPRTLLVLPEDDLLPKGEPCRLQSRRTLLDWPKPVSSGLSAVFHQVVTSGLKAIFQHYAWGQPEPGKRETTLQKTQNSHPVYQEREARPSTVLYTLPHEGEDAPPSKREGGKPSGSHGSAERIPGGL